MARVIRTYAIPQYYFTVFLLYQQRGVSTKELLRRLDEVETTEYYLERSEIRDIVKTVSRTLRIKPAQRRLRSNAGHGS